MTGSVTADPIATARKAGFLLVRGDIAAAAALCLHMQREDANLEAFPALVDLLCWARPRETLYPLVAALVAAGFANPRSFDLLAASAIWAGERDAARALMDSERFLSITRLDAPDAPELPLLAKELSGDLDYYARPQGRSIRDGWRRNHLEVVDNPLLQTMLQRLRAAAEAYVEGLGDDAAHPFLRSRPAAFGLRAWSVVSGADTRHLSHLHATSWMNGVYYVAVPDVVADAEARRGWLRVGPAAGRGFDSAAGWDEHWIRPEPGMVVMMPSHFSHETVALGCDDRRICVAFELYPLVS